MEHPLARNGHRPKKRHNRITGQTPQRQDRRDPEFSQTGLDRGPRLQNPRLKGATKEEAPYGGVGASSDKVPCGAVMGGKTITVANSTPIGDKCRDIFTKMVKVNELKQTGRLQRP